ncbi:hypothetical protein M9H77_07055 [Catharanthus roseus]|uniref:Uncharacterized protein n=1 Tax=Catharanthus roseus TaxID=4058 RepID=A0ACC0BTV3_CATRO|nr:hypothetical protein M9H77_07055 [Catharanthus roseus]
MKKPCKPFPLVHLQILNSQKQMNNNRQQTEMKPFLRYMNLNSRLYPKAFSSFVQHNVKWAKLNLLHGCPPSCMQEQEGAHQYSSNFCELPSWLPNQDSGLTDLFDDYNLKERTIITACRAVGYGIAENHRHTERSNRPLRNSHLPAASFSEFANYLPFWSPSELTVATNVIPSKGWELEEGVLTYLARSSANYPVLEKHSLCRKSKRWLRSSAESSHREREGFRHGCKTQEKKKPLRTPHPRIAIRVALPRYGPMISLPDYKLKERIIITACLIQPDNIETRSKGGKRLDFQPNSSTGPHSPLNPFSTIRTQTQTSHLAYHVEVKGAIGSHTSSQFFHIFFFPQKGLLVAVGSNHCDQSSSPSLGWEFRREEKRKESKVKERKEKKTF